MTKHARNWIILIIILLAITAAMAYIFTPRNEPNDNKAYQPPFGSLINVNTNACQSGADCVTTGCNGEICKAMDGPAPDVSVCVVESWHQCLELTSCSCVQGQCSWIQNQDFISCYQEKASL